MPRVCLRGAEHTASKAAGFADTHTHTDLDFLAVLVLAVAAGGMSHLPMDCCAAGGGGGGGGGAP